MNNVYEMKQINLQMDKASVLEDATKYIKNLQERVKTLEQKTEASNGKNQGVVSLKRSRMYLEEESSSSNEDFNSCPRESFPEIEVRMSEKNVLFRVESKNIPGLAVKLFSKIEKLHMTIVTSSVMPFSNSSLLITIISQVISSFYVVKYQVHQFHFSLIDLYLFFFVRQMDSEFRMSANDLVKTLQLTLLDPKSD